MPRRAYSSKTGERAHQHLRDLGHRVWRPGLSRSQSPRSKVRRLEPSRQVQVKERDRRSSKTTRIETAGHRRLTWIELIVFGRNGQSLREVAIAIRGMDAAFENLSSLSGSRPVLLPFLGR